MADRRLLVDALPESVGETAVVEGLEAHHGKVVLRLTPGEEVTLVDGKGGTANGVVETVARSEVAVQVATLGRTQRPAAGLTLALGVLHTQAMDWAVQKAVEVGVERCVPILAGRSQLGRKAARGRIDHWRRVARQALKQCRRLWEMEIDDPLDLRELVDRFEPGWVADPEGVGLFSGGAQSPVTLLVGPEGGLTEDELTLLDRAGWRRLSLGAHVLRAETAATVGSALLILRAGNDQLPRD